MGLVRISKYYLLIYALLCTDLVTGAPKFNRVPCETLSVALEKQLQNVLGRGRRGLASIEQLMVGLSEQEKRRLSYHLNALPPYRYFESDLYSIFGYLNPLAWHKITFSRVRPQLRLEILEALARNSMPQLIAKSLSNEPMSRGEVGALVLKLGGRWGYVNGVKRVQATLNWISRADPTQLVQFLYDNRTLKIGETQLQYILRSSGLTSRSLLGKLPYELETIANYLSQLQMGDKRAAARSIYEALGQLKAEERQLLNASPVNHSQLSFVRYRYGVLNQLYLIFQETAAGRTPKVFSPHWERQLPNHLKNWWQVYFLPDSAAKIRRGLQGGLVAVALAIISYQGMALIDDTNLDAPLPKEVRSIVDPANQNTIPPASPSGEAMGPLEQLAIELQALEGKYEREEIDYRVYMKSLRELKEKYGLESEEPLPQLPPPPE